MKKCRKINGGNGRIRRSLIINGLALCARQAFCASFLVEQEESGRHDDDRTCPCDDSRNFVEQEISDKNTPNKLYVVEWGKHRSARRSGKCLTEGDLPQ